MSRVTILRRKEAFIYLPAGLVEAAVEVTYSTPFTPARSVHLLADAYRPATPQELAASPRIALLPASPQALEGERTAISDDLTRVVSGALPALDYE